MKSTRTKTRRVVCIEDPRGHFLEIRMRQSVGSQVFALFMAHRDRRRTARIRRVPVTERRFEQAQKVGRAPAE